jgi:hypothetical protein
MLRPIARSRSSRQLKRVSGSADLQGWSARSAGSD